MSTAAKIAQEAWAANGRPARLAIDITLEPDAVIAVSNAINNKVIPGLYSRNGDVCEVAEVDDGTESRLVIRGIDSDALRMKMAVHTDCYRVKMVRTDHGDVPKQIPVLPSTGIAKAVLSQVDWPGLPALAGVTTFPVIRADGTVHTSEGYDTGSRLYYRPAYKARHVPEQPAAHDVEWARGFLLDKVLADFAWDSDASRANFIALLMTPLLRLYLNGLPPLGVISATTRGSGKTLLTDLCKAVYGLRLKSWPKKDEEMTKVITATLKDDTAPVVVFDNVGPFDTVEHASLAALLTSKQWSDRILGSSSTFTGTNDKLWFVTGNNVAIGGDIASRSVLVRLDPKTEHPEDRDGFVIDDLWTWLEDDDNRSNLMAALLVLARSWITAGATVDKTLRMRNFSTWAQAMGGFLAHHDIGGFLTNKQELAEADDDETTTAAFLAKWFDKHGDTPQRATKLVESARGEMIGTEWHDPWDGAFPTKPDGKPFTSKGLARYLAARRGRIFAGLVLNGSYDEHSKVWFYSVSRDEATQGGAS